MTTTVRNPGARSARPDPTRKAARIAGWLYLLTFVTSIPALALYHSVLHDRSYILHTGSDTAVFVGAFLEVICALAGIGTAVTLFPVVKRHSETAALGFVTSRVIEGAMIMVGVLSVLSIVTLHHDLIGASGADASTALGTGRSLVALHDWTFLLGPGVMPGVNALLLGSILYRSRLVPRAIPLLGLVGAPLLIGAAVAILFGLFDQVSAPSAICTFPIAAWEFSLGVWMVVKGFQPSPLTSTTAPDRAGDLVTAVA